MRAETTTGGYHTNSGYEKGRIRRDDIITAAAVLYGEVGYHGASLREIAKRVGITHAGLLYYFPTKEALLAAVLERRDAEDSEREKLHAAPGLDMMRRFVTLAEHNVRHPGIVDLYSRLAAEAIAEDHPAHDYFVRHYRRAYQDVQDSFSVMAERGELRDGVDPGLAALTFIALMDGLQTQWLTMPDAVDLVASVRFYLTSLLIVPLDT